MEQRQAVPPRRQQNRQNIGFQSKQYSNQQQQKFQQPNQNQQLQQAQMLQNQDLSAVQSGINPIQGMIQMDTQALPSQFQNYMLNQPQNQLLNLQQYMGLNQMQNYQMQDSQQLELRKQQIQMQMELLNMQYNIFQSELDLIESYLNTSQVITPQLIEVPQQIQVQQNQVQQNQVQQNQVQQTQVQPNQVQQTQLKTFGWNQSQKGKVQSQVQKVTLLPQDKVKPQPTGGNLIHDPSRKLEVYNPDNQTWIKSKFQTLDQNILILPNNSDKDEFISMKNWNQILEQDNALLENIYAAGYDQPSKIQSVTIPLALCEPYENLIAQAKTGTGKTVAFAVSSIARVDAQGPPGQILVITFTREIAKQIDQVYQTLCNGQQDTGVKVSLLLKASKELGHIIITTPAFLFPEIKKKNVEFSNLKVLILDEADALVEQIDTIPQIMQALPKEIQVLCFSATFSQNAIFKLNSIAPEANQIQVDQSKLTLKGIKQLYYQCPEEKKLEFLCQVYQQCEIGQTIIFANLKSVAIRITDYLRQKNFNCGVIVTEMTKEERDKVIQDFKDLKSRVLVSTNLISRGIDIVTVSLIVNFQLPMNLQDQVDQETYLHRIGRTGRFSRKGVALSIISNQQEIANLKQIESTYNCKIQKLNEISEINSWLLENSSEKAELQENY